MTTLEELEHLLHVERIHSEHFNDWEKRATDPLARLVFRLAADKEDNHVKWVNLLVDIARQKQHGNEAGVSRGELKFWVDDEAGEGDSYSKLAKKAVEPWVEAVLEQIADDERTNAKLLETLLAKFEP